MVRYPETAVVAKSGINLLRSLTERSGSLFHKIEQENDLGIDCIIEIVSAGTPTGRQVAAQVKTGSSYVDAQSGSCSFPIGAHRDYWSRYPIPVIGVVVVPGYERAYWVDIKLALRGQPTATTLSFRATRANLITSESFATQFLPQLLGTTPQLSLDAAVSFAASSDRDEVALGIRVLFQQFPNALSTWDALLHQIFTAEENEVNRIWLYYLAHVPWHSDIAYVGEPLSEVTKEYVRAKLAQLGEDDVLRLLRLIDPETGIARGVVGQSVDAIVSSLPRGMEHLDTIARTEAVDRVTREWAALIMARNDPVAAEEPLEILFARGSWFAAELLMVLRETGYLNPYA